MKGTLTLLFFLTTNLISAQKSYFSFNDIFSGEFSPKYQRNLRWTRNLPENAKAGYNIKTSEHILTKSYTWFDQNENNNDPNDIINPDPHVINGNYGIYSNDTIITDTKKYQELEASDYQLSTDHGLIIYQTNKRKEFRHSLVADYHIYRIAAPNTDSRQHQWLDSYELMEFFVYELN